MEDRQEARKKRLEEAVREFNKSEQTKEDYMNLIDMVRISVSPGISLTVSQLEEAVGNALNGEE